MFVINANASWSASATAYATGSGGNTALTSVSGYYDVPMNGSTYNMFNQPISIKINWNINIQCDHYDIGTELYQWWNGANPNETSLVECGKVLEFDQDVLFPNNVTCSNWAQYQFTYKTQISWSKNFPQHDLDTIVEIDMWQTPHIIPAVVASRKTFKGWEKVGRNINTYLTLWANTPDYKWISTITWYIYCNWVNYKNPDWWTIYALKCPITTYLDLWLLHSDGTKTIISHKEKHSRYYNCLYVADNKICGDAVWEFCNEDEVFFGNTTTEWAIACPGDRTYLEFWVCPACLLYDVYTSTKCTAGCTQSYWRINWTFCRSDCWDRNTYLSSTHYRVFGNNLYNAPKMYSTDSCLTCRAVSSACSTDDSTRFNWIQFSIE